MSMTNTEQTLQRAMEALVQVFPDAGIVLLVAPFGGRPGQRVICISNGERENIIVLLKELLAHWEGRLQEAPSTKQ